MKPEILILGSTGSIGYAFADNLISKILLSPFWFGMFPKLIIYSNQIHW